MTKSYAVLHDGRLASRHLTRKGALAAVGTYVLERKWDAAKLSIREEYPHEYHAV